MGSARCGEHWKQHHNLLDANGFGDSRRLKRIRHKFCVITARPPIPVNSLDLRQKPLSSSVRMTVRWFVPPHEAERITAALHSLMVAARSEPGYVRCRLSTDMGERARLIYVEEWNGEADLQRQLRSTRFCRLAELIERAVERPLVEFELPDGVRGLEYVEGIREKQGKSTIKDPPGPNQGRVA